MAQKTICKRCNRFMKSDRSDSMPLAGSTTGERVHLPNQCPKVKVVKVAPKVKALAPVTFEAMQAFAKSEGTAFGQPLKPAKIGKLYFIPKGYLGQTIDA